MGNASVNQVSPEKAVKLKVARMNALEEEDVMMDIASVRADGLGKIVQLGPVRMLVPVMDSVILLHLLVIVHMDILVQIALLKNV